MVMQMMGSNGPYLAHQEDVARRVVQKQAVGDVGQAPRRLVRQVERLCEAREHAMHLNARLNQMLDRIRGQQPAEASAGGRIVSNAGPNEPPVLDLLCDANSAMSDTLAAIERAVSELETIT